MSQGKPSVATRFRCDGNLRHNDNCTPNLLPSLPVKEFREWATVWWL